MMDVQQKIRDLMDERGWTDYRLCKESGLSASTITNMFNRNNAPTLPTLEAICSAFGITLSQFFAEGNSYSLTDQQIQLLSGWNKLSSKQQELILQLFDTLQ